MAKVRSRSALDLARDLLDRVPLIDGHNDLAWVIREHPEAKGDLASYGLERPHPESDTDIPRLRAGKVSAQWWAAYLPSSIDRPARTALEQIDLIRQLPERHPDTFLLATRSGDVQRARKAGKIASFLAIEGGVGLENSLAPLRVWHAAGARLMTLCHNDSLDWVDSATDYPRNNGLSEFGREVVLELNRLGMIVDCAHLAPSVMHQVLDISRAPIVFSHSNARALCDHRRNVPDDILDRLPNNGGIVMATFIPAFLSRDRLAWNRQFETPAGAVDGKRLEAAARDGTHGTPPAAGLKLVADHIDYIANRIGPEHVGIGSDFFGSRINTAEGLQDVSRYPYLFAELIGRGWPEEHLAGLAGGNFLRVFRAVERIGRRLAKTEPPRMGHAERRSDRTAPVGTSGETSR
jgi:membrane dipeptidase